MCPIHEFQIKIIDSRLKEMDIEQPGENAPLALRLDRIESIYYTFEEEENATHITMMSGDDYVVLMTYSEVLRLWKNALR